MKKDDKTYHFRDNEKLLENIEIGKRSKFIRDALKLKIKIDEGVCDERAAIKEEQINYYRNEIELYDYKLECLHKEEEYMKKYRNELKTNLDKLKNKRLLQ